MSGFSGSTCLVLGCGGFIGMNLCAELERLGAKVRGFGHKSLYTHPVPEMAWFQADFGDRAALARAVDGADIIFHLISGSIPESSNKDPTADLVASLMPSLHLLEICRASNIRKTVFVSSGGTVYGPVARTPIPETAATNPVSAYGISKLATEKYIQLYYHLYGLDYRILRLANPYGRFQNPNRRQGVVAALMDRILRGQDLEIWGSGDVIRDFVCVDDVIEAIVAVTDYDGPHKLFNVGSGVGRSISDVVTDVIGALNVPGVKLVHRPGRPADVPVSVLDISLIEQEIGWIPRTDWLTGLQKTASWVRGNLRST
jgi:UDP-glucose 4-epimerase